jgi:hypothetical protein
MMKFAARPTWKVTGPNRIGRSSDRTPITFDAGSMTIKQTLLPRSLDVSFEFKYRR